MSKPSLVNWNPPLDEPPETVQSNLGTRTCRTAKVTGNDSFFQMWKERKDELSGKGFEVRKDSRNDWWVYWWSQYKMPDQDRRVSLSEAADSDADIPCPDGMAYLPYQRGGIAYGLESGNVLIGDEMGLGKTIQALGILNGDPSMMRVLIVCPPTLKHNWKRETEKWLIRECSVEIVEGGSMWPSHFGAADDGIIEVTIINYDVLMKHRKNLESVDWDALIVDEAHLLKNKKADRTKALLGGGRGKDKLLPIKARRNIALSGTPILNRVKEIWNLAHWLAPEEFPDWRAFTNRYCAGELGGDGNSNLQELQLRLRRSFMVRRLKKDVLTELPAKRRQVIDLPPSDKIKRIIDRENQQWELHEDTVAAAKAAIQMAEVNDDEEAYKKATAKLKDTMSVAFAEMAKVRKEMGIAKVPYVVESVKDLINQGVDKVVVAAHHKGVIDGLMTAFAGLGAVKIDGSITDKAERQRIVDRFQEDPRCRIFVGSIKAAGVGITLTAASTVVFAELDWVPGNVLQMEDRCHRIGQEDSVLVQHLVMQGSLDARMAREIVSKMEIIEQALDLGAASEVEDQTGGAEEVRIENAPPKKNQAIGEAMTTQQREAAHRAVQEVAAKDSDGASAQNGVGFSKFDTVAGRELAAKPSPLTLGQYGLCRNLAMRYRKQITPDLIEIINPK